MQFKHPDILWALFLLAIPVIVHLFRLRRFEKIAFTNVRLLKALQIETRKSSQLKKWLTLLCRLLAFVGIIIAFAQPFRANKALFGKPVETAIYLDNSFSMQLKGQRGELLQQAVNELIQNIPDEQEISLFTNTETFGKVTFGAIKNDLIKLPYSSNQLGLQEVFFKAGTLFTNTESVKNFILISDFQVTEENTLPTEFEKLNPTFVKLQPNKTENISIDTAFVSTVDNGNLKLSIGLSQKDGAGKSLPVSLYNNERLLSKLSANFGSNGNAEVEFSIPAESGINGSIVVEDNGFIFDNRLYFTIPQKKKINVLAINGTDDAFLKKIYTEDEFVLTPVSVEKVNFNKIAQQELIVLNELKTIPIALSNALKPFTDAQKSILIICSDELNKDSYNQLFTKINLPKINSVAIQEKQLTRINTNHPVFKNVFDGLATNFEYPKVKSYYTLSPGGSTALALDDGSPFLLSNGNSFLVTASIDEKNSNFKNSPLLVAAFYSIGINSTQLPQLYYTIGNENNIDIVEGVENEEVISLASTEERFIPLQQGFSNFTRLTLNELPLRAGIFEAKNNGNTLGNFSFNYNRNENRSTYLDISTLSGVKTASSITSFFNDVKTASNVNQHWKWFVIFALVFLTLEMLILKYFK